MTDDEALKVLVALGDPGRFEMFRKVVEAPGLSSTDLRSGKSASTTSHHIKLLVDAGLLETTRDRKHARYNVHRGTLARFAKWVTQQDELATTCVLAKHISDNPI